MSSTRPRRTQPLAARDLRAGIRGDARRRRPRRQSRGAANGRIPAAHASPALCAQPRAARRADAHVLPRAPRVAAGSQPGNRPFGAIRTAAARRNRGATHRRGARASGQSPRPSRVGLAVAADRRSTRGLARPARGRADPGRQGVSAHRARRAVFPERCLSPPAPHPAERRRRSRPAGTAQRARLRAPHLGRSRARTHAAAQGSACRGAGVLAAGEKEQSLSRLPLFQPRRLLTGHDACRSSQVMGTVRFQHLQRARSALSGWRWPLAAALAILLSSFAAVALFVATFDWNAARGAIERRFLERTGRELVIGGDLDVQLRWHPRVIAHDVSVANPDWARRPELVTARRVTLALSLPGLLRGAIRFREIELVEPQVALEQRDGLRTWAFGREGSGKPPEIGRLRIADGSVEFLDTATNTAVTAEISSRGDDAEDGVTVIARGRYRGETFRMRMDGPSLLRLSERSTPYPLQASVYAGKTSAHLEGEVTGLPSPSALDLRLELAGDDLAHLRRILGVGAPSTPPYVLRGRLRRDGERWSFDSVAGTIGDSDVAGQLAY